MTDSTRPKGCGCGHPLSTQYADKAIVRCSCGRRWIDIALLNDREQRMKHLLEQLGEDPPIIDQAVFAIEDILSLTATGGMAKPRALEMIRKVVVNLNVGEPPPNGYLLDN